MEYTSLKMLGKALGLSADYEIQAGDYVYLLAEQIVARHESGMLIVGMNGAQGSGKSTLARVLAWLLQHEHALRTAVLSLDDLYLPGRERTRLAAEFHPLLRTRGVPGTHDIALGNRLLTQLGRLTDSDSMRLPRFDKAHDEPESELCWPVVQGHIDVLIFEGWCIGTPPQSVKALQHPVNALEAKQDVEGIWRHYVNWRLATDYRQLFSRLDMLIYLQVPSMREVCRWRWQQEQQLPEDRRMSATQIELFVQYFERLTCHALQCMPDCADIVLKLDAAHRIEVIERNQP